MNHNSSLNQRTPMACQKLLSMLGLSLVLLTNYSVALGLGELKLQSTLNESFKAEVILADVGNLDAEEIIVTFADNKEFESRKLERHFFYNEFKFDVIKQDADAVIHITSPTSISEPYLGFILEVRWPGGRLLREYTILMDMPAPLGTL